MTRTYSKILAIFGLMAVVILGTTYLEPAFFKSLKIDSLRAASFGVITAVILVFLLLAFGEIKIIDKQED